jgi:hypothetical protein
MKTITFLLLAAILAYVVSGGNVDDLLRGKGDRLSPNDHALIKNSNNYATVMFLESLIDRRLEVAEEIRNGAKYYFDASPSDQLEIARRVIESTNGGASRVQKMVQTYQMAKLSLADILREDQIALDDYSHPFELYIDGSNYASEESIVKAMNLFDKAAIIVQDIAEMEQSGAPIKHASVSIVISSKVKYILGQIEEFVEDLI